MGDKNINSDYIILLLHFSIILVYSPSQVSFSRFNCYESFSYPRLFFRLFIHTYSGPEYIFVTFMSEIEYNETDRTYTHRETQFHFKKINGSCESSNIVLTTHVLNYKKLTINVGIYFPSSASRMSQIHYYFHKGFKSDKYLLVDEYGNFGVSVSVINSTDQFLQRVVVNQKEADAYLRLLKSSNNHICIVTENNREVIIQPIWNKYTKADGYIVGVVVNLLYSSSYYDEESYSYHAYQCTTPVNYNKQTIFITEKNPQVYFYASYIKFDRNDDIMIKTVNFKINNLLLKAFNLALIIPKDANRVFLMKSYVRRIKYPGGTKGRQYLSKNGSVFYAKKRLTIEIEPYIEIRRWVEDPQLKICE